jgi:hypothetical protein
MFKVWIVDDILRRRLRLMKIARMRAREWFCLFSGADNNAHNMWWHQRWMEDYRYLHSCDFRPESPEWGVFIFHYSFGIPLTMSSSVLLTA